VLLTQDESRHATETESTFVIQPEYASWTLRDHAGSALPAGYRYASDTNTAWLGVDELRETAADVAAVV
jgi:UDP-N-acetylglucosamine 4,6-dehydratase